MKWDAIEPHKGDFKVDIPDLMIDWADHNNITVRGGHWDQSLCSILYSRSLPALAQVTTSLDF